MTTSFSILCIIALLVETLDGWESLSNIKELNDGQVIPAIGFGTFAPVSEEGKVEQAITDAINAGFRLINTAALYNNEAIVGEAINNVINNGIVTRDELFITAELDMTVNRTEDVVPALENSLERLQLSYINLYLMRFPLDMTSCEEENILAVWRGMENAKNMGLTNSIGVSNFNSSHINKILAYTRIRPAVNQFEVNPTSAELELVAYCQQQRITVIADAPFGFLASRPFRHLSLPPTSEEPTLAKMGEKYGKSPYQVILRYLIDRNVIPIPGSIKLEHIQQNIDVFDFQLTREEIYIINEFNRNTKVYPINDVTAEHDLLAYMYDSNTTNCQ